MEGRRWRSVACLGIAGGEQVLPGGLQGAGDGALVVPAGDADGGAQGGGVVGVLAAQAEQGTLEACAHNRRGGVADAWEERGEDGVRQLAEQVGLAEGGAQGAAGRAQHGRVGVGPGVGGVPEADEEEGSGGGQGGEQVKRVVEDAAVGQSGEQVVLGGEGGAQVVDGRFQADSG